MIVNLEELTGIFTRLNDIEAVDLADIEFREDGKKLEIDPKIVEWFAFSGMCNRDFIRYGAYLKKSEDLTHEPFNNNI